jgi:hypothetical protein
MKALTSSLVCGSLLGISLMGTGCGPGKDDVGLAAPPPPPPAAVSDVSLDKNVAATPPGGTTAPTNVPSALPPPTTDEGLAAITKGMTPKEIKEFKETASFETHDTQIGLISEAANSYYNENKKAPASVEELVRGGYLPRLLQAPKGKKYVIDPQSLAVTSINQ